MPERAPARVIGLMTGTSLDGIDAALVEFAGDGVARLVEFETLPFAEVDAARLRQIASGGETTATELSAVRAALARDHANAIEAVDPERSAMLVGAHGVTVAHWPTDTPGHGWQLLDGARLAVLSARSVASDFRGADLALGGQGAPLAPVVDLALRASADEGRVVLNLGGISNFTAIPAGATRTGELVAGDAGPANLILDGFMRRLSGGARPFDEAGGLARSGTADQALAKRMLEDPWFARPLPRSAGREQFGEAWLDRFMALADAGLADADRMATLVEVVACAIADQLASLEPGWPRSGQARVLVTGGGRRNRAVLARLDDLVVSMPVETIEAIGEDGDAKEAVDFAWLARERWSGHLLDLAPLTGASGNAIAGSLHAAPPEAG